MTSRLRTLVCSLSPYAFAASAVLACSGGDTPPAGAPGAGGAPNAAAGAPGAARPGAGGGRGGARAVLSATDVATIARGRIELTTAVTGDLKPLEVIGIRARIEADIAEVMVRDGDRVRAGQVLARLDAGELEPARRSAEADRAAAQAELSTAEWNEQQAQELFKSGAIAEGELRLRKQTLESARARVAATDARLRVADRDLESTKVIATTNGTIERRFVQPGERVQRGAQLFSLVRADVLELAAAVPAKSATPIRVGQLTRFTADGRDFTGRVARVGATIDPASRAVTVYVQVPNGDGSLKGNAFASGRIVQRVLDDVVLVPTAALRQGTDDGAPFVYRIEGEQIGAPRVTLGIVDDQAGVAEVTGGLDAGDRVVIGNVGTLGRGMKVTVVGEKSNASGGGSRRAAP